MVYGGIIPKKIAESSVKVSWRWYDQNQGIVVWKFENTSDQIKTVALYRGYTIDNDIFAYYFGDAYYPIYLGNPELFRTGFITKIEPLVNQNLEINSAPYGILKFQNGKLLPAFVYTLSPGEVYEMLEGGFTNGIYPTIYKAIELTPISNSPQQVCIGYPEDAVKDWDNQTGTFLQGFQPNPKTFESIVFNVENNAPYVSLWYYGYYKLGKCKHSCKYFKI